jgi:hypothetical protein
MIGGTQLHALPTSINRSEDEIMSKFDFSFLVQHNLNTNQLSCTINASLDLFNVETVNKISQRFHSMLGQLLTSNNNEVMKPL